MGRLFDEHILDLVEFEVKKATEIDSRCDIVPDEKPCIIFQGDVFEYDSNFMRIKNLIAGKNSRISYFADFFFSQIFSLKTFNLRLST